MMSKNTKKQNIYIFSKTFFKFMIRYKILRCGKIFFIVVLNCQQMERHSFYRLSDNLQRSYNSITTPSFFFAPPPLPSTKDRNPLVSVLPCLG